MNNSWARHFFTEEQYNIWTSSFKHLLMMWGRGSGKSEILMNLSIYEASKPNKNIWILAPTESDVIRIYAKRMCKLLREVWKWKENKKRDFETDDGIWYISSRKTHIEFKNGSSIVLMSSERCEKNEGNERLSLIILDEFAKFKRKDEFYSIYIPSLSPTGRLIISSTPKGKEEFWEIAQKAKKDKSGMWTYSYATAYSNTKYFEVDESTGKKITWADKIKSDMDVMPLWQWEQEYLCEVNAVEGKCCPEFNAVLNTIDLSDLPFRYFPDVPLNAGLDFNRSPMSWCLWQSVPKILLEEKYPEILEGYNKKLEESQKTSIKSIKNFNGFQDEIAIVIAEIKRDGMDIEKMMIVLDDYLESMGFNKDEEKLVFYGDATGNQKNSYSGKSLWESLKEYYDKHIFKIPKSNPTHWERVNITNKKISTANNKIGLLINSNCENMIDDFQQAVWIKDKWEIDKDKYDPHMFDGFTYGIAKLYLKKSKNKKASIKYLDLMVYGNEYTIFPNVPNNSLQPVFNTGIN